jgi:hypothetical protein
MLPHSNSRDSAKQTHNALWHIYRRPQLPIPPTDEAANLPWDDPAFSQRMLREHLDQSHSAASRRRVEILRQVGFDPVKVYPQWDGLDFSDTEEWIVYVAKRNN